MPPLFTGALQHGPRGHEPQETVLRGPCSGPKGRGQWGGGLGHAFSRRGAHGQGRASPRRGTGRVTCTGRGRPPPTPADQPHRPGHLTPFGKWAHGDVDAVQIAHACRMMQCARPSSSGFTQGKQRARRSVRWSPGPARALRLSAWNGLRVGHHCPLHCSVPAAVRTHYKRCPPPHRSCSGCTWDLGSSRKATLTVPLRGTDTPEEPPPPPHLPPH